MNLIAFCIGFQACNAVLDARWDANAKPVNFAVHLVREMEHVGKPFTQGLEFTEDGEQLIETSGSFPPGALSFVRTLDAKTGRVLKKTSAGLTHGAAGRGRFVEGITQMGTGPNAHWFASTYTDNVMLEYDHDFALVAEHHFPFQGWGLARNANGTAFFATNGSYQIMELAPPGQGNFKLLSVKTAMCHGRAVPEINELEMVHNFMGSGRPALLGNVLGTRVVIVLDPSTMHCIGAFDLDSIGKPNKAESLGFHVANGVAFNPHTGNFIVTGKNWERMFEIRLVGEPVGVGQGGALQLLASHIAIEAENVTRFSRPRKRHGLRVSSL